MKLLAFFDDPNKKVRLELELATLVDAASPFVQATYKLEGDGPLIFKCYDVMSSLSAAVHVAHYPNVEAISRKHAQDDMSVKQQVEAYSQQCMQPAYDYHNHYPNRCLKESLTAFKAARLFVPQKVQEMQPDALAIDFLAAFPYSINSEYPEAGTSSICTLPTVRTCHQIMIHCSGGKARKVSFLHGPRVPGKSCVSSHLQQRLKEFSLFFKCLLEIVRDWLSKIILKLH